MTNIVTINVGEHGNAEPPEKDKPVVMVNGVPIDGLYGLKFQCAAGDETRVTLSFYAKVKGKFVVNDGALAFANQEDFDRLMKEGQ